MATLTTGLRALPRSVWLLGTISLLNDSASEMIYPLLPLFLAGTLGAGPRVLGLIEGVAEAVSSLLKLVAGAWSDRMQRAKPFVVSGYGIAGVARTLIAAATGWWMVLLCRLADRVGKGLRSSPRDAMLGRSITSDQRGLAYGLHRAMDNAGAVIGPLVAAGLLALGFELRTVFWCAGVPAVVVLLLTLRLREPEAAAVIEPTRFSWRMQEFPPAFKRYLLVLGLFMLGNSSNLFLLLRVRELGFAQSQIPLLWALMSLVAAVFLTPLSSLSDRIGRRQLIIAGWIAYAVIYLLLGWGGLPAWSVWGLFAAYGLFIAATEGAEKALVADLVPREQLGTAFGWYHLTLGITLLPASLLFGWLWQSVSAFTAFAFGAGCALLAAALLAIWLRKT
ncbi:MFS transporter [Lysobacter sp. CFH 32150]|uniref:MFS transporter n=1 Tax=Lysobacter sp. CFH 32150 TaxID=2927128 RepID=UPI001FA6B92D|nr:MFS transporter [Lysobacter sp. CFH 32150]MCI4567008.1 MFS transporter [Lysobacter sp. CFH 32150]